MIIIICFLILSLNFSVINNTVSGFEKRRSNTYYVGGTGPGNYTKIQDAINNADIGSTILVYNDTYFENVVINKQLKIIGEKNDYPIIDGQFIASVVNITAQGVEFRGFTIMHSGECTPELYAGININAENTIITDNNITRNSAFGIRINSSDNILKNNFIKHNCGEGIYITSMGNNNLIYNNFLLDDTFDYGNNTWNISKTPGLNIIGGPYIGGNYWHDYQGLDLNSDALGDTELPHKNSGNILNNGDFHPLITEIYITNISKKWNYISVPFNTSIKKYDLIIHYEDNKYSWNESTSNNNPTGEPLLNKYIFSWDRSLQAYILTDILKPGYGYWIHSYQNSEIRTKTTSFVVDNFITNIQIGWNIISIPFNQPVYTNDIIVINENTMLTWNEAVDNNIINPNIFVWNSDTQSYQLTTLLKPGRAYWLYSYQNCRLKKNTMRG